MKRTVFRTAVAAAIILAGGVFTLTGAGEGIMAPKDAITIEGKKPVQFNHATHLGIGIACGECHHDEKHEARTAEGIAAMDDAGKLACATCHNDNFANTKLQQAKDVFHTNCRECHKSGYEGKNGPTSCNDCHTSSKKKAVEGC